MKNEIGDHSKARLGKSATPDKKEIERAHKIVDRVMAGKSNGFIVCIERTEDKKEGTEQIAGVSYVHQMSSRQIDEVMSRMKKHHGSPSENSKQELLGLLRELSEALS